MSNEPDAIDDVEDLGCEPLQGFFQIPIGHPDRELALRAFALELLHLPDGAMVTGWQAEFTDILAALKEGKPNGKQGPRAVK